nr:MAG TPA: hypothetical protein [Bacteriophage sp.]
MEEMKMGKINRRRGCQPDRYRRRFLRSKP